MPELSVRDRFEHTEEPTLLINGEGEKTFHPLRNWAGATLPSLCVTDLDGGHVVKIGVRMGSIPP